MTNKEASNILMRIGNQHLMRAINFLIPEISLEYGLDKAVMLALLNSEYELTNQVHSLINIDGIEYATTKTERLVEYTGIWTEKKALNLIECLISAELITVISDIHTGNIIFYVN